MKYLKHYYVDSETAEALTNTNQSINGKSHPNVEGLDVKFWTSDENGIDFCLSVCSDTSNTTGISGLEVLTKSAWMAILQTKHQAVKDKKDLEILNYAQGIRKQQIDTYYHSSEIAASASSKIAEARLADAAVDDAAANTAAPFLYVEAIVRGITTKQLATKVINNYNNMMAFEAAVAGNRGRINDMVTAAAFNDSTADTAVASFNAINAIDPTDGYAEAIANVTELLS